MLNRNFTFNLENDIIVSVDYKKIEFNIFPLLNISGTLISINELYNINIRNIVEKMFSSKIKSEHIGIINFKNIEDKYYKKNLQIEYFEKFTLNELTKDDINDNVGEKYKNTLFSLRTNQNKWMNVYIPL